MEKVRVAKGNKEDGSWMKGAKQARVLGKKEGYGKAIRNRVVIV